MNSIIKFRFYSPYEFKGMYNVVELRLDDHEVVIEDHINTSMEEAINNDYNLSKKGHPLYRYEIGEGVLMQTTAIFDINGKLIYEGDVLKYRNKLFKVLFAETEFRAVPLDSEKSLRILKSSMWHKSEIIGNICENENLLKQP